MNKLAIVAAMLAFVVPIGLVVGLNMSGTDVDTVFNTASSNSNAIPTGKLLYFYAPV